MNVVCPRCKRIIAREEGRRKPFGNLALMRDIKAVRWSRKLYLQCTCGRLVAPTEGRA